MDCELSYIPERLKSINKQPVHFFALGEILFRRCKKEDKLTHFQKEARFFDISVNRRGFDKNNIFSEPEDVLFNFNTKNDFEKYEDQSFLCLEIKELNSNFQYEKMFNNSKNKVRIFLNHRIEPCNYSHCCFEIYFNEIEITTKETYEKSLKKDSELKDWCKFEITNMMIKEEVRLNW